MGKIKEAIRNNWLASFLYYLYIQVVDAPIHFLNKSVAKNLDIGAGLMREALGWISLDERTGVTFDENFRLPFDDASLDFVYCSHVFEHLDDATVSAITAECYRVLKTSGLLRIVVPDQRVFIKMYKDGKYDELSTWIASFDLDTWSQFGMDRKSPELLLFSAITAVARDHRIVRYKCFARPNDEPPLVLAPPVKYIDNYYAGPPLDICTDDIRDKVDSLSDADFVMWAMKKKESAHAPFPIFPFGHRNDWSATKLKHLGKSNGFTFKECVMGDTNQKMLRKNDRETSDVNSERHRISLFVNLEKQ